MMKIVELLSEVSNKIYELDPMELNSPKESEYDVEALSILSRVFEIQMPYDSLSLFRTLTHRNEKLPVLREIVNQVFDFWFKPLQLSDQNSDKLCVSLLELLERKNKQA